MAELKSNEDLLKYKLSAIAIQLHEFKFHGAEHFMARFKLDSYKSMGELALALKNLKTSSTTHIYDRAAAELFLILLGVNDKTDLEDTWLPMLSVPTTDTRGGEVEKFLAAFSLNFAHSAEVMHFLKRNPQLEQCSSYDSLYVQLRIIEESHPRATLTAFYTRHMRQQLYLVWNIRQHQQFIASADQHDLLEDHSRFHLLFFSTKKYHYGLLILLMTCAILIYGHEKNAFEFKVIWWSMVIFLPFVAYWTFREWADQNGPLNGLRLFVERFGLWKFNVSTSRKVLQWVLNDPQLHPSFNFFAELRKCFTVRLLLIKLFRH